MSVFVEFEGRRFEAYNAASEDTLKVIAGLINNLVPRQRKIETDTANANRQQTQAANQAASSMQDLSQTTKQSTTSAKNLFSQLQTSIGETDYGTKELWQDTKIFAKELTATAINVGAAWTRTFAAIQDDPLRMGTMQINTAIDITSQAVSGFGKALIAAAKDLIPGGTASRNFVDKIARGIGGSLTVASDIAGNILKTANNIVSAELDRTVKALSLFNKMGGSFAGGMLEMRQNARLAGLTVDRFAKSVEASRRDFTSLGVNVADGSEMVARQLFHLANTTGTSGQALREELLALGYSYEEQGALASSYMSTVKAANGLEGLRNKTQKELAEGTRQYAADLKVLADITGQDAKAAAERARVEVQRAGLLNKLGPDQREAFQEAFRVMQKYPANVQEAFMNKIMGLPITDPTVAMSTELTDMVTKVSNGVLLGQKGMQDTTALIIADTQKLLKEQGRAGEGFVALSDQLAQLKVGGITADYARTINALLLDPLEREQIERSRKGVISMGNIPDEISQSVVAYTKAVTDFASQMSSLAGSALPQYSRMIEGSIELSTKAITAIIQGFKGELDATGLAKTLEQLNDAFQKLNPFINRIEPISRNRTEALPALSEIRPAGAARTAGLESSFATAMAAIQREQQNTGTATLTNVEPFRELSTQMSSNIDRVFTAPGGVNQVLTQVKDQIANEGRMQREALQEQIAKLEKIASSMEENIRVSERIANELV